jgi:hypothetical protein
MARWKRSQFEAEPQKQICAGNRDALAEIDALRNALIAKNVVSESDVTIRLSDENAQANAAEP